jgi:SAM-dependent methyltransferase
VSRGGNGRDVPRRQGPALLRDGVPYSDPATTLSLLPGAAVGTWLAAHASLVRGRLLDAGCGNSPFAGWYGPLADEVVTVDAVALPGVRVRALADTLPFADASFDTVVATEVLEHVTDAEGAARDMWRVLRPGGHLLATVPYTYPTHEAPYDFRRLTHYGLRSLLERHGFEVLDVTAKGGAGMLLAHATVLALQEGLDAGWRLAGRPGRATDVPAVRSVLAGPQQLAVRMRGPRARIGVRGSATRVSLGYMAAARKPG